jgi:membrane protease YdiL (CAAX protease family)
MLSYAEDRNAALSIIIVTFLLEGIFLIAPYYFARRPLVQKVAEINEKKEEGEILEIVQPREVWAGLGFRKPDRFWPAVLWVVVCFAFIVLANFGYTMLLDFLHKNFGIVIQTNDQDVLAGAKNAPLSTYATMAFSVVIASVFEEVFFRGFLFPGLLLRLSPVWAMLISAFLFAITHLSPGSIPVLLLIGFTLAFVRWRTDSIWPCIILHLLNNSLAAILIFLSF